MGLSVVLLLDYMAHESLPSCFVIYTDYRYGWGPREVGLALAGVGVASTFVQAGLVGAAVTKLGEPAALVAGMAFGAVGFAFYGLAPTGALFLAGIPFGALWGLAAPALQALMTRRVPPTHQGRLQGAVSSLRGIGGMTAPLLFTQVLASATRARPHALLPGAPFVLASAILVVCVVASLRVTRSMSVAA
jgi:DHA1 family tetracycline resistance protein-like MFS transporter